jgi:predicted  nucleic acid-binding Zn-ribbon protein
MTIALRDVLERLKGLQEVDLRIQRLDAEIEGGPAAVKEHTAAVEAVDVKIKAFEDRARVLRAQVKLRENDLKTHEQKVQRLKEQSSQVKTNREFVAFRSEIANAQSEGDRVQGEILKILEVVDQADKKVVELREARAKAEQKRQAALEIVEGRLGSVRAERERLRAQRPTLLKGLPPEPVEAYERARKSRGTGISRTEGDYCAGCMERLTRNDLVAVENTSRLVQCRSCNRILFNG